MEILKYFLLDFKDKNELRIKILIFYKRALLCQKRIKTQIITKFMKVEILLNYWDKIVGQLIVYAGKYRDKEAKKISRLLSLVQRDIRIEALKRYFVKCKELHMIAFMQWRVMFVKQSEYHSP